MSRVGEEWRDPDNYGLLLFQEYRLAVDALASHRPLTREAIMRIERAEREMEEYLRAL